jgi:hypothetical protein
MMHPKRQRISDAVYCRAFRRMMAGPVISALTVAVLGMPSVAAAASRKTAAPCYIFESVVELFGGIQPNHSGRVIDIRPILACRKVNVAGGTVSDYTLRLIGKNGRYRGKLLSEAVGSVWYMGDGNVHYTKARVVRGFPEKDWVL